MDAIRNYATIDMRIFLLIMVLAVIGVLTILSGLFIFVRIYLIGFLTMLSILWIPVGSVLFYVVSSKSDWWYDLPSEVIGISIITFTILTFFAGVHYVGIYRQYRDSRTTGSNFPISSVLELIFFSALMLFLYVLLLKAAFQIDILQTLRGLYHTSRDYLNL